METNVDCDIVICGGGNAGLVTALQLQLKTRPRKIIILDKNSDPSPNYAFKVGESIAEGASYHLRHTLELDDYFFCRQTPKFGFRFFFGGGNQPFGKRLEFGGTQWPPFATFQLDRGPFENKLREIVRKNGAEVISDAKVCSIVLNDDKRHQVTFEKDKQFYHVNANWLIDTSGRRRLLSNIHKSSEALNHKASASWLHVAGSIDIEQLVSSENHIWHNRVPPPRKYSTVHLGGMGYWVWIIQLGDGCTSVGIVSCEKQHPVNNRATQKTMFEWCLENEPDLASLLEGLSVLDFKASRDFSFKNTNNFSENRWAIVGDAAGFPDPLYAFGQDLIAHGASITTELVKLDDLGKLDKRLAESYNTLFEKLFDILIDHFYPAYEIIGNPFLYSQKLCWDSSLYFAILQQSLTQNVYSNSDAPNILMETFQRLEPLNKYMQEFFLKAIQEIDGHQYSGMRTWAPQVGQFADASIRKAGPRHIRDFFNARLSILEGIAESILSNICRVEPNCKKAVDHKFLGSQFDTRCVVKPAEWDVQNRIDAENKRYYYLAEKILSIAGSHETTVAVSSDTETVTFGQLTLTARHMANTLSGDRTETLFIDVTQASTRISAMLAAMIAGQPFVLVPKKACKSIREDMFERCKPVRLINDQDFTLLKDKEGQIVPPVLPDKDTMFDRPVYRDIRHVEYGWRDTTLDGAAMFRMHDWLSRLIKDACSGKECLWLSTIGVEVFAPLGLGMTVHVDKSNLSKKIGVVMGDPQNLSKWLCQRTPNYKGPVFSIMRPLPEGLLAELEQKIGTVYDFGYTTFAH